MGVLIHPVTLSPCPLVVSSHSFGISIAPCPPRGVVGQLMPMRTSFSMLVLPVLALASTLAAQSGTVPSAPPSPPSEPAKSLPADGPGSAPAKNDKSGLKNDVKIEVRD